MRWRIAAAIAALLLGVVGCGSEAEQRPDPTRTSGALSSSPVPFPSPTASRAEVDAVVTEFLDSLGADSRRA